MRYHCQAATRRDQFAITACALGVAMIMPLVLSAELILPFGESGRDRWQAAGGIAVMDPTWGGSNALDAVLVAFAFMDVADQARAEDGVYLFTSFRGNGEDGLRFLYSEDGYAWHNICGTFLKPHMGNSQLMRDPSISRGPDGTFHLVWTTGWRQDQGFGYARSKDLVHWSEQRFIPVMEHEPTTVNVWAPELFYDESNVQFIICWASTIPGRFPDHLEPHDNNQRMYYTTTRDFEEFAPAKLFFDPGFSVIDCTITQDGDRYVLVLKDNTRPQRNLRVAFGGTPLGPWREVSGPFTQQFTEGPSVLKLGNEWIIYFDAYKEGIYGAMKTPDFKSFVDITTKVSFPEGHKHGTVLRISRTEFEHLQEAGANQTTDSDRRENGNAAEYTDVLDSKN